MLDRRANLEVVDTTLVDAIEILRSASGVSIAYSRDVLPRNLRVTCRCRELSVREALDTLLAGTALVYRETRRQVVIGREGADNGAAGEMEAHLSGLVVEEGAGWPVPGVEVQVLEGGRKATTGNDGRFTFRNVRPEEHRLHFRAIGYQERIVPVTAQGEGAAPVTIELPREPVALEEIVIAPGRFGILEAGSTLMGNAITREDIEAIPQFGDDAFRTLRGLPGVATEDISSKLHVRGALGEDLLVRLDGLELFEPYHLKDFDGAFGIVDVQSLGSIDLVTGGLPAEYGDKWGGVLDMRSRQPPASGTRTTVSLSLSLMSLNSQGSFAGGRGQWLAALRRGYLDIVLGLTGNNEEGNRMSPVYWDAFGKVQYLLSDAHLLKVEVLHAGDDLSLDDGESISLRSGWASSYGWLTWVADLTSRSKAETMVSLGRLTRDRWGEGGEPGDGLVNPNHYDVTDRGTLQFLGLRQEWQWELSEDLLLKTGVEWRFSEGDFDYLSVSERRDVGEAAQLVPVVDTTSVQVTPKSHDTGAYLAARSRGPGRFTWEAGVRLDRQSHTGDQDWGPRLLVRWDLSERTSVKGSLGRYFQSQGIDQLRVADGETAFAGSELAEQVSIGVERRLGRGLAGRVEAYWRTVKDPRPVYLNLARELDAIMEVQLDRQRLDPARGRDRGIEVLLSREGLGALTWSASYALARSEYEVDGDWIPRALDQTHTVNLFASYRLGQKWRFSGSWKYHTGWPVTPQTMRVTVTEGEGGDEETVVIREFGPLSSERLPAYHQLDLRVTRSFDFERSRLELFLDLFNAYDRTNLRGYDYVPVRVGEGQWETRRQGGDPLLPLLPTAGFRWVF